MKENPLEVAEIEASIARDRRGSGRDQFNSLASELEPILKPLGITREPGSIRFTSA